MPWIGHCKKECRPNAADPHPSESGRTKDQPLTCAGGTAGTLGAGWFYVSRVKSLLRHVLSDANRLPALQKVINKLSV
jgi:hypothetical protein